VSQTAQLAVSRALAETVANLIVHTCSEQASATPGAALRVDGGVVRIVA